MAWIGFHDHEPIQRVLQETMTEILELIIFWAVKAREKLKIFDFWKFSSHQVAGRRFAHALHMIFGRVGVMKWWLKMAWNLEAGVMRDETSSSAIARLSKILGNFGSFI